MSYTNSVREQLYNVEVKNKCCISAEYKAVRAVLHMDRDGSHGFASNKESGAIPCIEIFSENFDYIKRLSFLCYKSQDIKPEIIELDGKYAITLPKYEFEFESELENNSLVKNECCSRAFLRGLFLIHGTVTSPEAPSVHIEYGFKSEKLRDLAVEILLAHEINAKKGTRRNNFTFYIKDSGSASDFLTLIGAQKARFDFDNAKAMREINNQYNRTSNIDVANFDKVSISSSKHLYAIRFLLEHDMYDSLPEELRCVADARMKYPDVSLAVLAEKVVPPLSKAGVNHRLKKIMQIVEDAEE